MNFKPKKISGLVFNSSNKNGQITAIQPKKQIGQLNKVTTERTNDGSTGDVKKFNRKSQHRINSKSTLLGTSFEGNRMSCRSKNDQNNGSSFTSILFPNHDLQSSKLFQKMKQVGNCEEEIYKESMSYNQMAELMKKELHKTIKPLRTNIQDYIYLTGNRAKYIKINGTDKELSTQHSIEDIQKNKFHQRIISVLEK